MQEETQEEEAQAELCVKLSNIDTCFEVVFLQKDFVSSNVTENYCKRLLTTTYCGVKTTTTKNVICIGVVSTRGGLG